VEIRTYTRIWSTGKTIYSLADITLPRPVSVITLAVFGGVSIIWVPFVFMVLGLAFSSPISWMIALGVPGVLAWMGNKPIFEDKRLLEYVMAQVGYFSEPHFLSDMKAESYEDGQVFTNQQGIWEPAPSERPIPANGKKKRRG
jgi:hypothetical protein